MSKAAGKNAPAAPAAEAESAARLPFEEAMSRLKTVVEELEAETLPLESLLSKYAEGVALAQACQSKLTEAELKVRQLETTLTGSPQPAPGAQPEPEP